ncbi:hypothetical protein [Xenorhabdus japonica]|uniref:Uncharacterized protein n=1 Tax=Xenorhabdus japonica TaxID=53341 RepID=A0A1I5CU72_9GAMM|nr:hypothetical protein [Xenorhabdus japonica]SFN90191.1 hypothetical protein SAMN05421579_13022 [Xenorhabdus japonica]
MKVKIEITKSEILEYINGDYSIPESECQELIQNDAKTILERGGFQKITMDDITVIIHE